MKPDVIARQWRDVAFQGTRDAKINDGPLATNSSEAKITGQRRVGEVGVVFL
jgi:hypothetical protein